MLTLLFALTGFMELPYILILLCNNTNQIYANIYAHFSGKIYLV